MISCYLHMEKEIESVQAQIQTSHNTTEEFIKDMAQRNSEASIKHRDDMLSAQMAVNDLGNLLLNVKNGEIESIITAVISLHKEIVSIRGPKN